MNEFGKVSVCSACGLCKFENICKFADLSKTLEYNMATIIKEVYNKVEGPQFQLICNNFKKTEPPSLIPFSDMLP